MLICIDILLNVRSALGAVQSIHSRNPANYASPRAEASNKLVSPSTYKEWQQQSVGPIPLESKQAAARARIDLTMDDRPLSRQSASSVATVNMIESFPPVPQGIPFPDAMHNYSNYHQSHHKSMLPMRSPPYNRGPQ